MELTGKIIAAFVTVLLGAVLIGVVAGQTQSISTTAPQTDSIDISVARLAGGAINTTYPFTLKTGMNTWRSEDSTCIPSTITFKNASTTFTTDTDYTYTPTTGGLVLKNTVVMNGTGSSTNATTATYQYCPDGYLTSSWQRSVLNMVPGFFGIAIMLVGVGLFYSIGKEVGII